MKKHLTFLLLITMLQHGFANLDIEIVNDTNKVIRIHSYSVLENGREVSVGCYDKQSVMLNPKKINDLYEILFSNSAKTKNEMVISVSLSFAYLALPKLKEIKNDSVAKKLRVAISYSESHSQIEGIINSYNANVTMQLPYTKITIEKGAYLNRTAIVFHIKEISNGKFELKAELFEW